MCSKKKKPRAAYKPPDYAVCYFIPRKNLDGGGSGFWKYMKFNCFSIFHVWFAGSVCSADTDG